MDIYDVKIRLRNHLNENVMVQQAISDYEAAQKVLLDEKISDHVKIMQEKTQNMTKEEKVGTRNFSDISNITASQDIDVLLSLASKTVSNKEVVEIVKSATEEFLKGKKFYGISDLFYDDVKRIDSRKQLEVNNAIAIYNGVSCAESSLRRAKTKQNDQEKSL